MPASPQNAVRRRKLLFVVTEDWFFCSHFLPMAEAARARGLEVGVVTRVRREGERITRLGLTLHPLEDERGARGPLHLARLVLSLWRIFRRERPDLVHMIALKPVILGGLAARLAGVRRRVYALTGQGFLGADPSPRSRRTLAALRGLLRWALDGGEVHYLFENVDDPTVFVPAVAPARVSILGGAGIDPAAFPVAPLPALPPLRVAVVARMLWQKGIDLAVEATELARARGVAVELSLYGAPDLSNPRPVSVETLRAWSQRPGIRWHGATDNVAQAWAEHHACCLPSRGGEGLPRALLEAAACGRALVTTDVPGCRAFVRDGIDGRVVPPGDAAALAAAFAELAAAPERLAAMGQAARARVEGFSSQEVAAAVGRVYARLLGLDGARDG